MTDADTHTGPGPAAGASRRADEGFGTHINDLLSLVIAYAKQETVDPIRDLGRYLAFGVAGAILLAAGGAMLSLTAVRLIQAETGDHLTGSLTWVPYLGGVAVAAAEAGWAFLRLTKGDRALRVKQS